MPSSHEAFCDMYLAELEAGIHCHYDEVSNPIANQLILILTVLLRT